MERSGNGAITYDEFYKFWRNDKRFEKLQLPEAELQRLQAAVAYFQYAFVGSNRFVRELNMSARRYFDTDKSGQLDKAEFANLHADLVKNGMTTLSLDDCFEELDTDASGTANSCVFHRIGDELIMIP